MDSFVAHLATLIFSNDSNAVIAVLVLVIFGLILDRRRLITENHDREVRNEERSDQTTDAFVNTSGKTTDALTALRIMLAELTGRK
jgi:hypothetical protein